MQQSVKPGTDASVAHVTHAAVTVTVLQKYATTSTWGKGKAKDGYFIQCFLHK